MMRLWTYRTRFDSPAIRVWVDPISNSELAPVGGDEDDFVAIENQVVRIRDAAVVVDAVGNAHFVDDSDPPRVWYVNEVRTLYRGGQLDISISRYSYRVGIGYDIPAMRTSRFGPPATWPCVDAAGVPIQVLRCWNVAVQTGSGPEEAGGQFANFRLARQPGDTGAVPLQPRAAVPASHRRRGGGSRRGALVPTQALSQTVRHASFWVKPFVFSPLEAAAYASVSMVAPASDAYDSVTSRLTPPAAGLAATRGVDALVEDGDFFVIESA